MKLTEKHFKEQPFADYRDPNSTESPMCEIAGLRRDLMGFYKKRYYLFSKYDSGIKID